PGTGRQGGIGTSGQGTLSAKTPSWLGSESERVSSLVSPPEGGSRFKPPRGVISVLPRTPSQPQSARSWLVHTRRSDCHSSAPPAAGQHADVRHEHLNLMLFAKSV